MKRSPALRARLAAVGPAKCLLFADLDGTLAPIVRRPRDARVSEPVRRLLRRLAGRIPVVIVSGRALADLRRIVGVPALRYIASHGLVYQESRSRARWLGRPAARSTIRDWIRALKRAAGGLTGAWVEDKGQTVALHDRLVSPGDRVRLHRRVRRALDPLLRDGRVSLVRGKRVVEVRPAGPWNKGTAVAKLLRERWAAGRVPVYFGDDRTDFDAFRVLRGRGLSVRVGGRRGAGGEDAWLPGPAAVASCLRWLDLEIERAQRRTQRNVKNKARRSG
ncbi:MAG: trehalose-phosphatase [Nitrospirae bacterium]|nr:trehalose-phosphatase [Nitrospirota bacterium]